MKNIKKNLILSAIGIGLQTAGGICLVAQLWVSKKRSIRKHVSLADRKSSYA